MLEPVLSQRQRLAKPTRSASRANATRWSATLAAREVHVWELPLNLPETEVFSLFRILAPSEYHRANGPRDDQIRRRFVVARAVTRLILGHYLDTAPQDLRFLLGAHGKPGLPATANPIGLEFNLAHSGDLGLLAIAAGRPLGIDVERMRLDWDYHDLVGRVLNHGEVLRLDRLPAAVRRVAFYAVWCRKEAYLKGLGLGIGDRLLDVEVSIDPEAPAALLTDGRPIGRPARWQLLDVPVPAGYRACLAVGQAAALAWQATSTASLSNSGIPLTMYVAA